MGTGIIRFAQNLKEACRMALTSSMKGYPEAILILRRKYGHVRCVDVSVFPGVTKGRDSPFICLISLLSVSSSNMYPPSAVLS